MSQSLQPWLIAYDIHDSKRRSRLHTLLSGYGQPVQKSVFLCHLPPARAHRLAAELEPYRAEPGDRVMAVIAQAGDTPPAPATVWVAEQDA